MTSHDFAIGDKQPLMRGFRLFYSVSGEPLEQVETIQVVVRLPFCLYIPSSRYLFPHPETRELIGLVPEKVWTDRAEGSTVVSSELVVAGEAVYLADTEVITDWIGTPTPLTGGLKARNMEFDKDPTGHFRYTRLTIETDWEVPSGFDPYNKGDADKNVIGDDFAVGTLEIVNLIIDSYRVVTKDAYIERVPSLVVDDIRIGVADHCSIRKHAVFSGGKFIYKCGYHPNMFSMHGIRPAMVSKSKEVVSAFRQSLSSGLPPDTHQLLRLSAQAALERHDSKLAVIESFLSLEVYVEQFYHQKLHGKMSVPEIETLLTSDRNWQLRTRLSELLRNHCLHSISDKDNKLWEAWLKVNAERNSLVHRNIVPTLEEAATVLRLNDSIARLMETL